MRHFDLKSAESDLPEGVGRVFEGLAVVFDEVGAFEVQENVSQTLHLHAELDPEVAEICKELQSFLLVFILLHFYQMFMHVIKFLADHLTYHVFNFFCQLLRLAHFTKSNHLSGGKFPCHVLSDGNLTIVILKHSFLNTFPGRVECDGLG